MVLLKNLCYRFRRICVVWLMIHMIAPHPVFRHFGFTHIFVKLFFGAFLTLPVMSAHAQSDAPKDTVSGAIVAGDLKKALAAAQAGAEQGEPESQFNLGIFYWHGVNIPQNFEYSLRWVTLSALGGYPKAMPARVMMIKSLDADTIKLVMDWIREKLTRSAEGGENKALVMLSVSYAPDFGFEDPKEAYFWASIAVASGRTEAKRRRDALVKSLQPADIKEVQDRSAEWFNKWRKSAS